MIYINVIGQKMHQITSAPSDELIDGSQEFVRFVFNLSEEWRGLNIFAQFIQDDIPYNVYLDEKASVYLPPEITSGQFSLTLYGSKGTTVGTANCLVFKIGKNRFLADGRSVDITPTLYNQLVDKVDRALELALSWDGENALKVADEAIAAKRDAVDAAKRVSAEIEHLGFASETNKGLVRIWNDDSSGENILYIETEDLADEV